MSPTRDGMDSSALPLQDYLAALPEPAPAAHLWPRIENSRQRRRRRRQLLRAAASLSVLFAIGAAMLLRPSGPPPIEQPIAALPVAPASELRAIDRQLQAAYDREANSDYINALWQAREAAANPDLNKLPNNEHIISL